MRDAIDIRRSRMPTLALVALWLATCVIAFRIGSGSSGSGGTHTNLESPASARAAHQPNRTREIGTVNRFVAFTQTLRDDELARLLPEMTEKMNAAQVQVALQRLEDEVEPSPARRRARFELIDRWAQLDAVSAFDHIDAMADPKLRHDLKWRGIKGWASADPAAALSYVREAEAETLPDEANQAVWAGLGASRDVHSALEFVPYLEVLADVPQPAGTPDVAMAVGSLYQNDDLAVIAWVEDLPASGMRDRAIGGLIDQWARHDPHKAIKWIEKHADPSNIDEAYDKLSESWARHDPQGAAAWDSSREGKSPAVPELVREENPTPK